MDRDVPATSTPPRSRSHWAFLAVAVLIAGVAGVFGLFPNILKSAPEYSMDSQEVFASHLRTFETDDGTPSVNIHSSDPRIVQLWLEGRLDFTPPVRGLSVPGFPLVGARLDFMHDRPVAALVYLRDGHLINLFIWPGETRQMTFDRDGFHLIHWSDAGFTFWAISNVNPADLQQFTNLVQAGPVLR